VNVKLKKVGFSGSVALARIPLLVQISIDKRRVGYRVYSCVKLVEVN